MVFADLFFLFCFIPAFALVYLLACLIDLKLLKRGNAFRNWVLVVFSLLFYAWGEPVYVFLMLGCVLANFIFGRLIDRQDRFRKAALVCGVVFNLLVLCTFKYLGLIVGSIASLGFELKDPGLALPIGISFYTFQSISYLIDVYRREAKSQRRFRDLLLYISMFPQLIAGPIVRYDTIASEINERKVSSADFAEGIFRFLTGLGKKVIIANQLSEVGSSLLDSGLPSLSTSGAWVGILAFTLQIYFDFSGYSDMAIGMGRCLGFHFKENFDHPYCCTSITDFWRRWHISLGSFFRDYVYIPMGGNRRHQPFNILTVWMLTGIWHGASWNFLIWGLYFGLVIMTEKYTLLKIKDRIPSVFLHLYSLLLVTVGWGIFYFTDFGDMRSFFGVLFGHCGELTDINAVSALQDRFWLWIAALVLCLPVRRFCSALLGKIFGNNSRMRRGMTVALKLAFAAAVLILSASLLVGATNNAFLYTRF